MAPRSTRSIATRPTTWPSRWPTRRRDHALATKYAAPFKETCSEQLGPAPRAARRSSPAIGDHRQLRRADEQLRSEHGAIQWTRDVLEGSPERAALRLLEQPDRHKTTVITTAGGPGRGVVAYDPGHRQDGVAVAGFPERLFIADHHRPRRPPGAGRVHLRRNRRPQSDTGALEWSRPHKSDQGSIARRRSGVTITCSSSRRRAAAAAAMLKLARGIPCRWTRSGPPARADPFR